MEFSEKLKELRSEKGISQAKLAADIHISRSAVAKWENGLGLPNDESLKLLADYFGVTIDELIPNKSNEEILVSKNKTIDQQKKVIIGFAAGCAIGLFILGFIFIEPLRESLVQLGLGVIFVLLGIFNMCGNIGTIHWYNRRKVTKENPNINRPIAQPAAKPIMTFFCWSIVLFFDTRISSLVLFGISSSIVTPK